MTARLLKVRHDLLWPESGPATALRAAGGLHAFLRGRHPLTGDQVRAFLVLDPTFPRSMLGCALGAEQAARELEAMGSVTSHGGILRTVGLLRSELEFVPAEPDPEIVDRLADYGLVSANEAGAEVRNSFFEQIGTVVWSH